MAYGIDRITAADFIKMQPKLPRFQRKQTWGDKDNFKLCISVFKQYPIGVVIVNEVGDENWLLDGRQRRTALKELRANPDLVYEWARKYIKFKSNQDIVDLKHMFWDRIDAYLQQEEQEDDDTIFVAEPVTQEQEDEDINKWRQREGLNTLLEIILMVHQKKTNGGK